MNWSLVRRAYAAMDAPEGKGIREGDWQCCNPECINNTGFPQHYIYGAKMNCPKCGTGRTAQRPGDWCCPSPQCVNHTNTVYGSKLQCTRCGAPRPPCQNMGHQFFPGGMGQKGQKNGARPGDWHCPIEGCKNFRDNVIYSSKAACPLCGTPKPAAPVHAQPAAATQDAVRGGGAPPPPSSPFPGWGAPGILPHGQQFAGGMAGAGGAWGKGGCQGGFQGGKGCGKGQPGDWHCPNAQCKNHQGNVNFASKDTCTLCGTPKPIGSVQHFNKKNDGDWQCPIPTCKNHHNYVYASKPVCSICGTPNPNLAAGAAADRMRSRSPRGGFAQASFE